MYAVVWCGPDGIQQERRFFRLPGASLEALKLRHRYDGVEIVNAETGEPVELM